MMQRALVAGLCCAFALLAACGEKPQTVQTRQSDTQPWAGAPGDPYVAAGWKPGDEASWERQMRTRAQGQNEYARGANMQ